MKEKKMYFEVMRIIACFFVIFDHTSLLSFNKLATFTDWNNAFWYYFCKFPVMVFFMISGALILGKTDSIKKYISGIIRVVIILFVTITISYLYFIIINGKSFSLSEFIHGAYNSCDDIKAGHLWYLYAYIGFLVASPFLRLIAQNMTNNHFKLLLGLMVTKNIIVIFEYFFSHGVSHPNMVVFQQNSSFLFLTDTCIFYPLIGYYIENKIDINKLRNKLIVLWIINIATILIAISLVYHRINVYAINDNDYACFRWTFVYVNAITIFLTLKYLFSKIRLPHSIEWGIKQVSSCTFGIYLIHLLILNIIPDKYKYNTGILHFVFSIIVFLICFLIIRLIKFIPIIKKYL